MRKICVYLWIISLLVVLAVLGAMVWSSPARAADASPPVAVLSAIKGKLADALCLTGDQRIRIKAIRDEMVKETQAVRQNSSLTPAEKRERIQTIRITARSRMAGILSVDQREKLANIAARQRALIRRQQALAKYPKIAGAIARKLDLTAAQKDAIKKIHQKTVKKIKSIMQNTSLPPRAKRARVGAVRAVERDRIARLLTPEQRQKLAAVTK